MAVPRPRLAAADELPEAARLLDQFNREFGDPSPGVERLTGKLEAITGAGETEVLISGEPPCAIAVYRFRESIWYPDQECYLAELYVEPELRGRGIGRALLSEVIERARARGAGGVDLGTAVDDTQARALYESMGFTNLEGGPGGSSMLVYELEF